MENNSPFSTGADASHYDSRTLMHDTTTAVPLVTGGFKYLPTDIENQHRVGICTAISLTQNAAKALGRKFSADFQYLLQKKFYDLNWDEGSSIFNALKVGTAYGFLPAELFTWVTENDRDTSYDYYIQKLQAIPDAEIQRLIGLCTNKLTGYAQVPTDSQSIAKGINDSKSGLLTRYIVGPEWWEAPDGHVSYDPKDIDPLRLPIKPVSGHAIGTSYFDFTVNQMFEHPNTWGVIWDMEGRGHTNHLTYLCTEAWIPYYDTVPQPAPPSFIFTQNMRYGQTSQDIVQLQKRLNGPQTGYYGDITRKLVYEYQVAHGIRFSLFGYYCGPQTRMSLNTS